MSSFISGFIFILNIPIYRELIIRYKDGIFAFWFIYTQGKEVYFNQTEKMVHIELLISWKRYDRFRNAGYEYFSTQSFQGG